MMASDAGCILDGDWALNLTIMLISYDWCQTVVTLSVRVSVSIRNDKLFTVP